MFKFIKKNSKIKIKKVDLFNSINIKTCYILKVYLKFSYIYLKNYYKKIIFVIYIVYIIFYFYKK